MEQNRSPTRNLPAVPPFATEWRPKAIIFDLLTALLDSWTLWNLSAGSAENGHKWRTRYLELTFGCGAYKPYEELVEQAARDVELDPGLATTLLADWDKLKPWPEVEGTVEKLRQKGYKMGVVTNCSISLGRRAAAIVGRWDGVITAEEVGYYKPHLATYASILSTLDVKPEDALFVAGSSGDVVGAAGAGMRVVWNNHVGLTAKSGSDPLREGNSLDELLAEFLGTEV